MGLSSASVLCNFQPISEQRMIFKLSKSVFICQNQKVFMKDGHLLSCHRWVRFLLFLQNQLLFAFLVNLNRRFFYGFEAQIIMVDLFQRRRDHSFSGCFGPVFLQVAQVPRRRESPAPEELLELSDAWKRFSTGFSLGDKPVILKIAAILLAKVSNCVFVKIGVKSQPRFALKLF